VVVVGPARVGQVLQLRPPRVVVEVDLGSLQFLVHLPEDKGPERDGGRLQRALGTIRQVDLRKLQLLGAYVA